MKLKTVPIFALAAVILLVGQATQTSADVLYSQPTDLSGGVISQNDTSLLGNYATAYDNFTLRAAATVNNVQWTGDYSNGPPAQGTITAFTLNFWSDNAGQPDTSGSPLLSESIGGNANETPIAGSGLDKLNDPTFTYSADLPTAFMAAAGTQYWLSIVPDVGNPPQWAWENSSSGDGVSYQAFFGTRSNNGVDLAFTLNGDIIQPPGVSTPEPGSLTLLCLGLASVGAIGWIRNRKATVVAG